MYLYLTVAGLFAWFVEPRSSPLSTLQYLIYSVSNGHFQWRMYFILFLYL